MTCRRGFLSTVLALCLVVSPGCGLTLDYQPPDDAGFDAARDGSVARRDASSDAGDGGACLTPCLVSEVCVLGQCLARCATSQDCVDDTVCEMCDAGVCVAAPPGSCEVVDGCIATTCDPVHDACVPSEDTCAPEGLICLGGACTEIPCTDSPGACDGLLDVRGCPLLCGATSGTCESSSSACVRPPDDCHTIDRCTCEASDVPDSTACPSLRPFCDASTLRCVGCLESGDCARPAAPFCDPTRHVCVACLDDTPCTDLGLRCDTRSGTCVECTTNTGCASSEVCDPRDHTCTGCSGPADCLRFPLRPICDPSSSACVGCLTDRDCPDPQSSVCDPTRHQCRACGADSECPSGACSLAARQCVAPACTTAATCPAFACATADCSGGSCVYTRRADFVCDDGIACTDDECAPERSLAPSGCVFTPNPSSHACDDSFSCTDDVCRPGAPGALSDGCVHVPVDARCSSGRACAIGVCAAGERDATIDPATGCGLSFIPDRCDVTEYCDAFGNCREQACGLATGLLCPDDANPCNGTLLCLLGVCRTLAPLTCDGASACGSYCGVDGCHVRSTSGGLCVDLGVP